MSLIFADGSYTTNAPYAGRWQSGQSWTAAGGGGATSNPQPFGSSPRASGGRQRMRDQYSQPGAGRQSPPSGGQEINMGAWGGRARSMQPPSSGTRYGSQPLSGMYAAGTSEEYMRNTPDTGSYGDVTPAAASRGADDNAGRPFAAYQTTGGGYDDPRWAHNGGNWGDSRTQPQRQSSNGMMGEQQFARGQERRRRGGYQTSDFQPYDAFGSYGQYRQAGGDMSAPFQGPAAPASPPPQNYQPPTQPFTSTVTDPFGNQTSQDQFWPQQQAFISQLLGTMRTIPGGTYLGEGAPPPGWGQRPQMDFGGMWNQAGNMVQSGWANPLAGLFG